MASITTVLRLDKTNKKGFSPVNIRIIKNRKIRYITTGVRLEEKHWDKKYNRISTRHPNSKRLNAFISKKFNEVQDKVFKAETDTKSLSTADLKDHIFGKPSPNFLEYAYKFIDREFLSKKKDSTYDRYKSTLNKLKDYLGNRSFTFDNLTVGFLKDYELHLRKEHGNGTNTIGKDLKSFRRIINEAIIDQVFSFEKSPFHRYKIKWEKTTKNYLSENELKAFQSFEAELGSAKDLHKDMFVFACYAGGLRVSDVCLLKWITFNGTHIKVKTRKTNEDVSIKLPEVALNILKKYRKEHHTFNDLIFPVLTLEDLTKRRLHKIINSKNSSANKSLKLIAKKVGLEKHVSFHTSRHTFATLCLSKGMKIHHVSKLLGHASIKTTEVYAKIVNKDLDDAMDIFDK